MQRSTSHHTKSASSGGDGEGADVSGVGANFDENCRGVSGERAEHDSADNHDSLTRYIAAITEQFAEVVPSMREEPPAQPDSLLALAETTERLARLVEAAQVFIAGNIVAASDSGLGHDSLAARHGCKNPVELLQRVTRASASELKKRVRLSEQVRPRVSLIGETLPARAPHVADSFVGGALSATSVGLMTDTLRRGAIVAPPELVESAETLLVDAAIGADSIPLDDDQMRTLCRAIDARLDQDGTAPKDSCVAELRGIRFGKERNGLIPVNGLMTPELAALFARLIDAHVSPRAKRPVRFHTDEETPVETDAQSTDATVTNITDTMSTETNATETISTETISTETDDDPQAADPLSESDVTDLRTPEQKRHDALAAILGTVARHPETPLLGGAPVTVLMRVDEGDLANDQGVGWVQGYDGHETTVPLAAIRHSACAGTTMRVTQAENGRIVQLGIADRIFNAHQRKAITLRDGGCVIPGCSIPASWCEIHHVKEHARGGATHTDNGVLLCWYHHRSLDTSGWEIRMKDGAPEVKAPAWIDATRRWRPTETIARRAEKLRTA